MTKLGDVKAIYLADDNKKKSAIGKGEDKGSFIEIKLNPSKRRTKFNTVLIPWNRVIKVIIMNK